MEHASPAQAPLTTPIERFVWDLTYACPLRCVHCLTESGRRPAAMLDRDAMLRVVEVIVGHRPLAKRMSFGGGEPLLAPWWDEAARLICERIPSAERLRFGSSGSEVAQAAMRLARAATGRRTMAAEPPRNSHETCRDVDVTSIPHRSLASSPWATEQSLTGGH